jgi:hypothetical protein
MAKSPPDDFTELRITDLLKTRTGQKIPELSVKPGIPHPVRLQLAPILCWKCRHPIKAARGYAFAHPDDPDSQAFTPSSW